MDGGLMLSRTFDIDLFTGLLCNQKQNGRCWIYASLAPFRQKLGVQLSTNYVYYFDQMRKAEAFLAKIKKWKDRELNEPELSALLREPISTVGQWCYFASLVSAHGLVPLEAMPDTAAAENSLSLTRALQDALRYGAWELREGKTDSADIMGRIGSILREYLGQPPACFQLHNEVYAPLEYYRSSGIDLHDYITLIHHPSPRWPSPCAYHEDKAASDPFLTLLSVDMETIKTLALRQLQNGEQVVIGADVRRESSRSRGELNLLETRRLPKVEAIAYRQINACHVMSIDGWASDGRWRVQDSHGLETGPDGHYVMTDAWFDAFVLSAVIRKDYLTPELLSLLTAPVYMPKEERF
ncbi:MAG: hypothetical protein J5967_02585 [Oscillospiraceae bacterium]|nr:hypothetical protein [Oscillospiraceae bacterium]